MRLPWRRQEPDTRPGTISARPWRGHQPSGQQSVIAHAQRLTLVGDPFDLPDAVWTPVGAPWLGEDAPTPVRTTDADGCIAVGVLEAGETVGDITVPAGHCGLGFRGPDETWVYVATRENLLAMLDRVRAELRGEVPRA